MDIATNGADVKRYPIEVLRQFCESVFRHFDVPAEDAQQAAAVLSAADRRGIDSHGVARLKTYFDMLRHGRINPQPTIEVVRETPSTATVDGDNGLGLVVGPRANALAMEKAEAVGSGWVSVRNTNHYGIAGYYVLQALERDLIGMAMTNSTKLVAPHRGAERMLGTNPIAMAFPGKTEPPVVIDLATSCVAYGKVEIKRREQAQMPYGWAIDRDGHPTQDPDAMIDGGAQLPLGSDEDRSGHKGYCLAAMVDILTCVLSGANWGPFAPPFALRQEIPEESVGKGIGHFFGAWQIEGFRDPEEFKAQIDKWVQTFRATKPVPGAEEVLIPGDPERHAEARRQNEGVPVLGPVVEDLERIVEYTGIPLATD
ncbi:MAG: Ldh family oxidoreductase [Bacteroidetes bacterium]|jgi:LDH2 family malate/lactate/ureidoglycolate dehydrogenase|nr:Ldh family oxidoreductase [Bacteroidota bacterium]